MEVPAFEEVQKHLAEKFLQEAPTAETDEELGSAFLGFILQSERIRHGVIVPSPEQSTVDRQTISRLAEQTELGSEFSFVEGVFKRLAKDVGSAMPYFWQAVKRRSATQAMRAKSPRPRRYDSITRLINDIVAVEPEISTRAVLNELADMAGIVIADDEIRNTQDATTMKVANLASRVTDAKKRLSGLPG